MRRLAPVLAGVAGVGVVIPFFTGVGPRNLVLIVPAFALLGAAALAVSRRTAAAERGWSGPTRVLDLGPTKMTPVPAPRSRPPVRKVAAALARVEGRELASSPWFGVGIGFLVISYLLFTVVYASDNGEQWAAVVGLAPWLAHPLVGIVVVAAHRCVTRARRDGADEIFDTCPVGQTTRTWGALGAAWVPVVALVVFYALYGVTISVRSPNLYGSLGIAAVARVLSAIGLGVGGVVLGVALGRWVRFALAPVIGVVAVGFFSLRLATIGDPGWNPLQQLSMSPPTGGLPPVFTDAPAWSHLAWVVALTGAVLVVAVVRHRRDRTVVVAGAAACLLVAVTGVAATRPMPGSSATRLAGLISDPAAHQVCRAAGSIQVCVYPDHEELADRIVAQVMPVAAMLPGATSSMTLRLRYPGNIDELPPEVARRLPDGVPPVPAGEVPLGFGASPTSVRAPRFLVANRALGLPVEQEPDHSPVVIAGQARGVVALWLAVRGLGPDLTSELTSGRTEHNGEPGPEPLDAFDRGYAWPTGCGAPVVWSAQDLRAARALIALPEATVRAAVHQQWERWRDPATGTDQLLAAVGHPSVGPFDAVEARPENPC